MRPVMVIQGEIPPSHAEREALVVRGIKTAVLVTPEVSEEIRELVINDEKFGFQRVILISSLEGVGSLGVVTHDLEGILGLEVKQNLLNFWQRGLKRGMDIILSILLLVLVSPLLLIIPIVIRLEGRGGILFKQCRVGRNGREFFMWKFRTMVPDADKKLQGCLEDNPNFTIEWNLTQKLKTTLD